MERGGTSCSIACESKPSSAFSADARREGRQVDGVSRCRRAAAGAKWSTTMITVAQGTVMARKFAMYGMQVGPGKPSDRCRRPPVLPRGWSGVAVERLWARGRPMSLVARHGDERTQLEPL
jgi:hypothetical protein